MQVQVRGAKALNNRPATEWAMRLVGKGGAVSILALCASLGFASAATGPQSQIINGPNGGRVLMTALQAPSEQDALIVLLRDVHQYFGARPQLGQILKDRKGNVSAFFSDMSEGKEVDGIAIVSPYGYGTVVYDIASRFPNTANTLLKIAQAHAPRSAPASAPGGGPAMDQPEPAAPLTQTTFPDGSGSIGMPQGWRFLAAYSGGAILEGPNRERLIIGNFFPVIDPNTPRGYQQLQMAQMSGRGLPGKYTAVPYTQNVAQAYVEIANQLAQKQGNPPPRIEIHSAQAGAAYDGSGGVVGIVSGVLDFHDGEGAKNFKMQLGISAENASGWSVIATGAQVPVEIGRREANTLTAMLASYRSNNGVIGGETAQAIGQIDAYGDAARAQANNAHAQEGAQQQGYEQHMRSIDRQGAGFSDYLLDQSVVANSNGEHKRFSNAYANALVQSNPQEFSVVPQSGYIQGKDY